MNRILHTLILLIPLFVYSQSKQNLYLIPGQGSDYRIYKNIHFDSLLYNVHYIHWELPAKNQSLPDFAKQLSTQIDTTSPFSIIGVSLGGMIATEISTFMHPEKVIIISSAQNRNELPKTYRFQQHVPLYTIFPKRFLKYSAFIAQPLFEPDRRFEKATCKAMLQAKDPKFVKRTVAMIMEWDRTSYDSTIVHIHGNNDNTIPIKNVQSTYIIENGSHMMILTHFIEIQEILDRELKK